VADENIDEFDDQDSTEDGEGGGEAGGGDGDEAELTLEFTVDPLTGALKGGKGLEIEAIQDEPKSKPKRKSMAGMQEMMNSAVGGMDGKSEDKAQGETPQNEEQQVEPTKDEPQQESPQSAQDDPNSELNQVMSGANQMQAQDAPQNEEATEEEEEEEEGNGDDEADDDEYENTNDIDDGMLPHSDFSESENAMEEAMNQGGLKGGAELDDAENNFDPDNATNQMGNGEGPEEEDPEERAKNLENTLAGKEKGADEAGETEEDQQAKQKEKEGANDKAKNENAGEKEGDGKKGEEQGPFMEKPFPSPTTLKGFTQIFIRAQAVRKESKPVENVIRALDQALWTACTKNQSCGASWVALKLAGFEQYGFSAKICERAEDLPGLVRWAIERALSIAPLVQKLIWLLQRAIILAEKIAHRRKQPPKSKWQQLKDTAKNAASRAMGELLN